VKRGLACCSHIVEHVSLLKAQRGDDRQDTFDKPAPVRAIGSEASFSPQDTLTENSFREVVRGLDPFEGNEGPERGRNVSTVLRQRARAIYEGKELAAAGTREGGGAPATRGRVRGALGALSPIDASTTGGTAA
jgi:hypothetical protein